MKKKNLAIIITKLNGGGAERCASNLSIELSKMYEVTLITFDGSHMTYPYGGELIDLKIPNSNSTSARIFNVLKRAKAVKKIKREKQIDCTISLLDGPNLVNVLSRQSDKVIVSIRNCLSKEPMGRLRRKLVEYTGRKTDLTVTLSKYVELDMVRNFSSPEEKTLTIYNHCDAHLLKELACQDQEASSAFSSKDGFHFVTMGRLSKQKGQWHLLRAFKQVLQTHPESRLSILGEGELENELKQLAKELEIEKNIDFLGYIKNPHGLLMNCDAFVFPSIFEGLGNVLLEALAMNLPIISADCLAGPREILAPNTSLDTKIDTYEVAEYGILTPRLENDCFDSHSELNSAETELAKAMMRLVSDEKLRQDLKTASNQRIRDFNKQNIISQWCSVID